MKNNKTDPQKSSLLLIQGQVKKYKSAAHCPMYAHPLSKQPPKRVTITSCSEFQPQEGRLRMNITSCSEFRPQEGRLTHRDILLKT
jgi:hypothetical protein